MQVPLNNSGTFYYINYKVYELTAYQTRRN